MAAATSWRRRPPRHSLRDEGGGGSGYLAGLRRGAIILPCWEGAGLRLSSSRSGFSGVLTPGAGAPPNISWLSGPFGRVLSFPGSPYNNYVDLARPLISDWKRWTVGIVFRTSQSSTGTLWTEGAAAGTGAIVVGHSVVTPGDVRFRTVDDAGVAATFFSSGLSAHDGLPHVLVARESAVNVRDLWFDGVSVASNATTLGTRTTQNQRMGLWSINGVTGEAYSGEEMLVVLWPRKALSDALIRQFSANPFGVIPEPLMVGFAPPGQLLAPNTTIAAGGWQDQAAGSSDLHTPLADENPATWAQSPANPSNATLKVGLTDIGAPGPGTISFDIDAEQV